MSDTLCEAAVLENSENEFLIKISAVPSIKALAALDALKESIDEVIETVLNTLANEELENPEKIENAMASASVVLH